MDLYRPVRFLFGECVYCADGREFARTVNAFSAAGVRFRAAKPDEAGSVEISVPMLFAERAEATAKKNGTELALKRKSGLPFLFAGYMRRAGLLLGGFLVMAALFVSQLFVWRIEIEGGGSVQDAKILKALAGCGVEVGTFIPEIEPQEKANELLMLCRDISSAAITVKGTYLKISVLERAKAPEIVDRTGVWNVVASRDGIITDIDAFDGSPEVKPGDAVTGGQLLINAFSQSSYGTYRPVHARGSVFADVNERFETEIPLKQTRKRFTGRTKAKEKIEAFGAKWNLFFDEEPPFEYFDAVIGGGEIKLLGFIKTPFRTDRITYLEYIPEETVLPFSQAESIARAELDGFLAQFDCVVKECEISVENDEKNGVCRLKAEAVLNMDIALEKEIKINDYSKSSSARLPNARE